MFPRDVSLGPSSSHRLHLSWKHAWIGLTIHLPCVLWPPSYLSFSLSQFELLFYPTAAQLGAEASADDGVSAETVPITFIDPLGKEIVVQAEIGKNLLDIANNNNIELEGKGTGLSIILYYWVLIIVWCRE